MAEKAKKNVLLETDDQARLLARRLLREARYAALACLDPDHGFPLASRVTLANEMDGTPIILVSELSSHTPALLADDRCSLLIGEMGKGDPLAHPRMTVWCRAERIEKGTEDHRCVRERFLNRHPKAQLYVDFADFHFFRLNPETISLNGGFAKAYMLESKDLLLPSDDLLSAFSKVEAGILTHMNDDHSDAIAHYALSAGHKGDQIWRMTGIDSDGIDLMSGDKLLRVFFDKPLSSVDEIRPTLVAMAQSKA